MSLQGPNTFWVALEQCGGSEFMKLCIEEPHKFELNSDNCCVPETSKPSKSINIILKDSLSYYIDSSQEDDILSMISNTKYDHEL